MQRQMDATQMGRRALAELPVRAVRSAHPIGRGVSGILWVVLAHIMRMNLGGWYGGSGLAKTRRILSWTSMVLDGRHRGPRPAIAATQRGLASVSSPWRAKPVPVLLASAAPRWCKRSLLLVSVQAALLAIEAVLVGISGPVPSPCSKQGDGGSRCPHAPCHGSPRPSRPH